MNQQLARRYLDREDVIVSPQTPLPERASREPSAGETATPADVKKARSVAKRSPKKAAGKRGGQPKRFFTDERKARMSVGQQERQAVRRYLEAVGKPRLSIEKIEQLRLERKETRRRLDDEELDVIGRLDLLSRLHYLSLRIDGAGNVLTEDVEEKFIAAAKGYSERKNIPYAVWRQMGVPADILKKAGVTRSGS